MTTPAPTVTENDDFERQLLELRRREKAHTREGDAIAAARRRLFMTEVPPDTTVIGPDEHGALIGPRDGGRPVPQWTRPGVTGVAGSLPTGEGHVGDTAG